MDEYQIVNVNGEPVRFPASMSDEEIMAAIEELNAGGKEEPSIGGFFKNAVEDAKGLAMGAVRMVNPFDALTGPGSGPIDTAMAMLKDTNARSDMAFDEAAKIAAARKAGTHQVPSKTDAVADVAGHAGRFAYEHPVTTAATVAPAVPAIARGVQRGVAATAPVAKAVALHPATQVAGGAALGYMANPTLQGALQGAAGGGALGALEKIATKLGTKADDAAPVNTGGVLKPKAADPMMAAVADVLEQQKAKPVAPRVPGPSEGFPTPIKGQFNIGRVTPDEVAAASAPFTPKPKPAAVTPTPAASASTTPAQSDIMAQLQASLAARMSPSKSKARSSTKGLSENDIASIPDVLSEEQIMAAIADSLKKRRASRHQTNYSNAKDEAVMRNAK